MPDATLPRIAAAAPSQDARVAFLLVSGFAMLGYASIIETLRAANQLSESTLYSWTHVAPQGGSGTASNGVEIRCETSVDTQDSFDFVFVCASDEGVTFNDQRSLAWLRSQAKKGAVIAGIGGGAFLLARAKLLGAGRVTLHWAYAPAFAEQFPECDLHRSLYEIDGDRMTCGGGMSPLDMMHAMIIKRHGIALAMKVSEWILHTEIRDSQESQRLSLEMRLGVKHAGLIRVLEAMDEAIENPLPRSALVSVAGVSERQLDRLFLAQLGTSLTAYYLRLRLNRARSLVIQTAMSMTEVAIASGFNSTSTFSKSYRAAFEVSPTADREAAFRGRQPNADQNREWTGRVGTSAGT